MDDGSEPPGGGSGPGSSGTMPRPFASEPPGGSSGHGSGGLGLAEGVSPPKGMDHNCGEEIGLAKFFTVKPSELHVESRLGTGAQADVYKAVWTRKFVVSTSSIVVAVKRLKLDLGQAYRDREALTILTDHPNIVKCFDCTLDPPYLVISEFCAGGSLFDLLYNTRQVLTKRQKIKILSDVAGGMKYLHEQKPCILHRDLKSSNVLLMKPIKSAEQEPFAKVADFGLARTSEVGSLPCMTVGVGTWRWMAPEVFDHDQEGHYCETADVFSFAMLMYETMAGKLPYSERYPSDSMDPRIGLHICMGLRPELGDIPDCPPVFTELMKRCWSPEPQERPGFQEIDAQLREVLETAD